MYLLHNYILLVLGTSIGTVDTKLIYLIKMHSYTLLTFISTLYFKVQIYFYII